MIIQKKTDYDTVDMNTINKRIGYFILNGLNICILGLLFRNLYFIHKLRKQNPKMNVRFIL